MAQQRELPEVKLDHMAGIAEAAQTARMEAARLIAFAEEQEQKIKDAMIANNAQRAVIFGVPWFTYTPKQSYAFAKFRDDHPHIYRSYLRTVEKEELDKDALLRDQADILADYQTVEFRRVNRLPGT